MQLLEIKQNEGLVTIEIEIIGTPAWVYTYQEDQKHSNDNYAGRPLAHTLGMPYELVVNTHVWEFRLGNTANTSIVVDTKIIWYQEIGNPKVKTKIHEWKITSHISANSGKLEGDSCLIIKI
jgi:hypothetical protein